MTTQNKPPRPLGLSRREAWTIRSAYVGSAIVAVLFIITGGIMGAHVYRWQIIIWGFFTLGWIFAWSYQVSASQGWEKASNDWREAYELARQNRVTVIQAETDHLEEE